MKLIIIMMMIIIIIISNIQHYLWELMSAFLALFFLFLNAHMPHTIICSDRTSF